MQRIIGITAIIATTLFAVALFAQGPGERRGGHRTPDALIEYLQLDEEQVAALQENNRALRQEIRTIMQNAREERGTVREELEQDNPNPTIIGQALVDAKEVREAIKAKREEYRANALAVLTGDQQNALAGLQQALDLAPTAKQGVMMNLLEGPEGEMQRGGFGPRRGGGRGPRAGGR